MSWLRFSPLFRAAGRVSIVLIFIFLTAGLLTFFLGYWYPMKKDNLGKTQCIIVNNSIETYCVEKNNLRDDCSFVGTISIKTRTGTPMTGTFTVIESDSRSVVQDKLQQDYSIGFPIKCYVKNRNLTLNPTDRNKNMVAFVFSIIFFVLAVVFLVVMACSYCCMRGIDD